MIRLAILTCEGILAEGFRAVLSAAGFDVHVITDGVQSIDADLLLIDVASLTTLESAIDLVRHGSAKGVLWCDRFPCHLTLQAIEDGVRGILPVTSSPEALVQALRGIHAGEVVIRTTNTQSRPPRLSRRGRELLALVCRGLKNKEIATAMGTTEISVKTSLHRLYRRTGVHDRFELALFGLASGAPATEFAAVRKGKSHEGNRYQRVAV